ncbi:hypothetical protein Tco_0740065 [Tanacetum coccineum]
MTTLAEHMIVAGAENRPPMLDKTMYNSWKSQLTEQEKLQDDYDIQGTNIFLQCLPPNVYSLVNHCQAAKEILDRVKLLMQGTEFSYQERECKMYNEFDKFTSIKASSSEYKVSERSLTRMEQTQLNHTPPSVSQNAYHTPPISQQPQVEFPQLDSGLTVQSFLPGDDPIACLKKAIAFMSTVMASCFPLTNNQVRTTSNPRNQATIQDGRVTIQQVQRRQGQSFASTRNKRNTTSSRGNNVAGQARESGQELDKEKLAFLADPGIPNGQAIQTTIPYNAAFQTDDVTPR